MVTLTWKTLLQGSLDQEGEEVEIEIVNGQDQSNGGVVKSRRKDRGKWPSLYDECQTMLASSVLMYAVTDLRHQIRLGKITDPDIAEPFISTPTTAQALLPVVEEHKEVFNQMLGQAASSKDDGDPDNYAYLDLVLAKRQMEDPTTIKDPWKDGFVLLEIDDERSQREMVYSISLNHPKEWIEICFRGSVTIRDFMVDADPFMEWYPNPVPNNIRGHPQDKLIGVHSGFVFYMSQTISKLGEGKAKRIRDYVINLQKEYPHYRVYTTGHSLGGAFLHFPDLALVLWGRATLMAFLLAVEDGITGPVSCVSVASPMVGNVGFLNAFQEQRYWHVGAKILLYKDQSCAVRYRRRVLSYRERVKQEWSIKGTVCKKLRKLFRAGDCGSGEGDFLKNHSCKEYIERLDAIEDHLKGRSLQELYVRQARSSINVLRPPELSQLQEDLELDHQETTTNV
ncbi:Lipase (class 3) [Seminavis robusta]|uniref:Lipase (Class 3) n=1 Tax=Seminavis robusta TaxID=568900 RepID=A0A9N8DEH4_9STRA|nr:Lipase (class 3) [Seminavis robusta]|eukprot:Sro85_g045180.1 Lipase (class 3) (453) ;mRNA; f:20958-22894